MYNDKILEQLKELKYLYVIKNSNVSVISKKNSFGDTVKFYAQITKNNVIQRISFKAIGCTHFNVYCDYFCSLIEGKTIDQAQNISNVDFESLGELDESRIHVLEIILSTFAMLIKKYKKGIEKGTIVYFEDLSEINQKSKNVNKKVIVHKSTAQEESVKKEAEHKSSDKMKHIHNRTSSKQNIKISKNNANSEESQVIDNFQDFQMKDTGDAEDLLIIEPSNDLLLDNQVDISNSQNSELLRKSLTSSQTMEMQSLNVENSVSATKVTQYRKLKVQREVEIHHIEKATSNYNVQASNIVTLNSMVSDSQQINDKTEDINYSEHNIDNLNSMIDKMNNSSNTPKDANNERLMSLRSSLENIKNNNTKVDEKNKQKDKSSEKKDKIKEARQIKTKDKSSESHEKKGLFSWFKRKK